MSMTKNLRDVAKGDVIAFGSIMGKVEKNNGNIVMLTGVIDDDDMTLTDIIMMAADITVKEITGQQKADYLECYGGE